MGHHFQVASEEADQGGSGVPGAPHLSLYWPSWSSGKLENVASHFQACCRTELRTDPVQ